MSSLGDLVVTVGGDVSGFSEAVNSVDSGLTTIADKAARAADVFDNTFLKSIGVANDVIGETAASFQAAATSLDPFADAARQVGEAVAATFPPMFQFSEGAQEIIDKQAGLNAAAEESIARFTEISAAYQQGAASAQDVARAEAEMHDAIAAVNPVVEEAHAGFGAFGESLGEVAKIIGIGIGIEQLVEGLKDLTKEAINAFGEIEMASAALTELTGSAESAELILEKMKEISKSSIFPDTQLIQAAQKMVALGVAAEKIPGAMQAVAAAAQVTGNGLDAVTGALDRIYLSATIQPRTLAQLGISMKDLAETMGISADKVTATFKELGPQSDAALQILTATISRRMEDAQKAMEGTLPVAINRLKAEWHDMLEEFGKEIAPTLKDLLSGLQAILPIAGLVTSAMIQIGAAISGIKDTIDVFKLMAEAISGVSGALKSLDLGTIGTMILDQIASPIKGLKAIILDTVAAYDVWKGKYPDLTTAIMALNAQLDGQKKATTELTDQQKASRAAQDEATAAAVRQAQAAAAAAAAHKDLKDILKTVEDAYHAMLAQFEGGTATQEQLAFSMEALRKAAAAANVSFGEAVGTTKEFQDGLKSLHEAQVALYIPAILDHASALAAVEQAHRRLKEAEEAQAAALATLATANTSGDDRAKAAALLEEVAARVQVKNAIEGEKVAREGLKLSESAAKTVTEQLAAADKEYLDLVQAATGKAILPYAEALAAEQKAKDKALVSAINLTAAQKNLQLAYDSGSQQKVKDAQLALNAAQDGGKIALDALKAAHEKVNDSQAAALAIEKALTSGTVALDSAYTKFSPHLKSLAEEMADVEAKQKALIQAEKDETNALAELQALHDAGINSGQRVQEALDKEVTAKGKLVAADKLLSDAEKRLQQDYGLSNAAIRILLDSQKEGISSAQLLADAYAEMGMRTQESLNLELKAAQEAYSAMAAAGKMSVEQQAESLQKLIAAYQAAGQAVPDSLQIAYGQATIKTEDFINNSIKRWTQFAIDIDNEFKGMFSGLINDLFTGGDFIKTMEDTLKKVGETIVSAVFKPFTDLISQTISSLITPLATTLAHWISDALIAIFPSLAGALGTAVGAATTAAAVTANTTALAANTAAIAALTAAVSGAAAAGAAGSAVGAAGDVAGSTAGAIGQAVGAGLAATVSAITGVVSAVTGVISVFQQARQENTLNAIEQNTRDSAFYLGGNNSGGGITQILWQIKEAVLYGFATKDLDAIKDMLAGGLNISSGGGTSSTMLTLLDDIKQAVLFGPATKDLDDIKALLMNGLVLSGNASSQSTAPASGETQTSNQQSQQQSALEAQRQAILKVLADQKTAYIQAMGQYQAALASINVTQDQIVLIKAQIAKATEDLANARTAEQQAYYRDLLATLQDKLVTSQTQLDSTQAAVQADLNALTNLGAQITETQAKLEAVLTALTAALTPPETSTPPPGNDTSKMPSVPGGSRTDTAQERLKLQEQMAWYNLFGQVGNAPSDFSQIIMAPVAPIVNSAPPVPPPPPTEYNAQAVPMRGDVYIDGSRLWGAYVQWGEDRCLVVPQS